MQELFFSIRFLVGDGRFPISISTLMRNVNNLYAKVGFNTKISSKSAKVLGTSLAFELGMSNDQVMLLGRWKIQLQLNIIAV